jgi:hypothetical protein
MRTATPASTWSRISALGAVGDVGVDLDAAVHGPGVHHDGVGLGAGEHARLSPKVRAYSRVEGNSASVSRSRWMRSIITTSAPVDGPARSSKTSTPYCSAPPGAACAARRRAPSPRGG